MLRGTAALHLRDQLEYNNLLADPEYRRGFRREFLAPHLTPALWHKDFHDAIIVECPDSAVVGRSFGSLADERGQLPLDTFLDVLVDNATPKSRGGGSFRWGRADSATESLVTGTAPACERANF